MDRSKFPDRLYNELLDDDKRRLTEDFRWISPMGVITVPRGFVHNFANVIPEGSYDRAALIHDYLYVTHNVNGTPIDRKTADMLFRQAMEDWGVGWFTREYIYLGVRMFGGSYWEESETKIGHIEGGA